MIEHGAKLMREGFERWWAVMGTNLVNEIGTRVACTQHRTCASPLAGPALLHLPPTTFEISRISFGAVFGVADLDSTEPQVELALATCALNPMPYGRACQLVDSPRNNS